MQSNEAAGGKKNKKNKKVCFYESNSRADRTVFQGGKSPRVSESHDDAPAPVAAPVVEEKKPAEEVKEVVYVSFTLQQHFFLHLTRVSMTSCLAGERKRRRSADAIC